MAGSEQGRDVTQLHLNRTPAVCCVESRRSREAHGEPVKAVQTGGEGGLDQGGEKCLETGRTVSLREVTRFSDRLEVAEKGARKLENGWVTGNFIVPRAELGRTRRGLGGEGVRSGLRLGVSCLLGIEQGPEFRKKAGSHQLSMEV